MTQGIQSIALVLGTFDLAKKTWRPEPEMAVKVIVQGLIAVDPAVKSLR